MNNSLQPSFLTAAHNNQSLFSDHYLNEILRRSELWRTAAPQAELFLAGLRELYDRERDELATYNESQLEEKWFEPIFELLGYTPAEWEKQPTIPGWQGKITKPDFVFFPNEAERRTAVSKQNSVQYAAAALNVAEVKRWGTHLSRKMGSQPTFDQQNPMYQLDTYLSLTGLSWGILSNGRSWRLLHKSSSRTLETYFEIDLADALTTTNETRAQAIALYFWLFFRAGAFQPDNQGRVFVDDALNQSRAYAIALEADLRDNAYRALEHLIIGFFTTSNGRLDPHNPDDRQRVYQNSLYLLYRLMFVFYAESRALLPINQPIYQQQYSLQELVHIIDQQRNDLSSLPVTGQYYADHLGRLFKVISGVDPRLNADLDVPRYNGGLFDPVQHPFLEEFYVGDRTLAQAIDYLATRRIIQQSGHPEYQRVDYRTLDVRQLGSIYEGLLEYKVAVAEEEMVTISRKGVETWVPLAQRGKAKSYGERRQPGELYLTTDKGERKATGSYYTPDYIVEYIVAQTLGPLVEAARAAEPVEADDQFAADILRLNVLDPAMGSGHFLVEATNYLARVLATNAVAQKPDAPEKPGSSSDEDDLLYWKRRVVENCIYGVDKNPMAVELAKLSLWLKTAASDKPLSFLDHHLQCGDSLIGAWLADLSKPPRSPKTSEVSDDQVSLFDESAFTRDAGLAVGGVATITALPTEDIEDVYAKERTWREVRQTHIGRWRRLADLWVSGYFGNEMTAEEYRALADQLQGRDSLMSAAQTAVFLNHPAVTDNDYLHWELAFPEIFFDEYGRSLDETAGFDAVIGNPPYVRQEVLSSGKQFLQQHFTTYHNAADLYVYFMELSVKALRQMGLCGLIVSHKFMRADYGLSLRKFLTRQTQLQKIVHFGDLPIFDNISAYPAILLWQRQKQQGKWSANIIAAQFDRMDFMNDLATAVAQNGYPLSPMGLKDSGWTLRNGKISDLQQKIMQASIPLKEYVEGQIHYGIKTGLNRAFFIDRAIYNSIVQATPSARALLKPLAVGEDLQRYFIHNQGQYIIVIPAGWTRAQSGLTDETAAWEWLRGKYGTLADHLAPFADEARQRRDMGDFWWELRPCAYYAAFEDPKIIYPVIAKDLRFSLDYAGFYGNDKTFIIPKEDLYLLALLNARPTAFFAQFALSGLRGDYLEFRASHFQNLPIFAVTFTTPQDERTAVLTTAQSHYAHNDYAAILALTAAELAAGRSDTVHDILAYLAEQMIAGNQTKQAAVKRFWLDMQGVCDTAVFEILSQKGKQQASLHKNAAATRPYVQADSRAVLTLEDSLAWNNEAAFAGFVRLLSKVKNMGDLAEVYGRYASDIATITTQLTAVDQLIDQIVYQLYALTPEEIGMLGNSELAERGLTSRNA